MTDSQFSNKNLNYAQDLRKFSSFSKFSCLEMVEEEKEQHKFQMPALVHETKTPKRWERLYQMNQTKTKNLELLEQEKRRQEETMDKECTFHPKISSHQELHNIDHSRIYQKNIEWERKKEERLQKIRNQKTENEERECSARIIRDSRVSCRVVQSKPEFLSDSLVDKFIERQKKGRKQQEEKKKALAPIKDYISNNPSESSSKHEIILTDQFLSSMCGKSFKEASREIHNYLHCLK